MINSTVLLVVAFAVSSVFAEDIRTIENSGNIKPVQPFVEKDMSFDSHADIFYFAEDLVKRVYARKVLLTPKITLAGQAKNMIEVAVPKAVNPFVVGEKALFRLGTYDDRWDIRENSNGHQFIALYHGTSNFVADKLRAHVIRHVANAVQDLLPVLDRNVGSESSKIYKTISLEIETAFKSALRRINDELRDSMKDNDENWGSASVVIVTDEHIVVGNVGPGRVLAYSNAYGHWGLTPSNEKYNVFGDRKNDADICHPSVSITTRYLKKPDEYEDDDDDEDDEDDDDDEEGLTEQEKRDRAHKGKLPIQFLVITSPRIHGVAPDKEVIDAVRNQAYIAKDPKKEQEAYTMAMKHIIDLSTRKLNLITRLLLPVPWSSDFTAIVVGLSDFKNVH